MKLAMTLMVRDEADIIEAMIKHHLNQGVDVIIATDNGSIDGTLDVLKSYAATGVIDLREDHSHRKQQSQTVTQMARDAYDLHGADWVINADADEFWLPVDRARTLKDVFSEIPKELNSFTVPVIDMIGAPAQQGAGLKRLAYRDQRSTEELRAVGLLAHSTHDAAHIGTSDITVSQGNHYVNLASTGRPAPHLEVEVLHLPWRSWDQYSRKVENAGLAYEASGLTPSPNHHGMRDYRRLQNGTLFAYYVARHPADDELEAGLASGALVHDPALANLDIDDLDQPLDRKLEKTARKTGRTVIRLQATIEFAEIELGQLRHQIEELHNANNALSDESGRQKSEIASLRSELESIRNRKVVRLADGVSRRLNGLRKLRA